MAQPIKFPGIRPFVDGITGILILSMVVGLPVVGWFYYNGTLPFWRKNDIGNRWDGLLRRIFY